MTTESQLQATLDAIKNTVGNVATRLSTLNQTVADLQAQIAAGTPVTQDQLDALNTESQAILDGLNAALAPPATPAPVTPPATTTPATPATPATPPATEPAGGTTPPATT